VLVGRGVHVAVAMNVGVSVGSGVHVSVGIAVGVAAGVLVATSAGGTGVLVATTAGTTASWVAVATGGSVFVGSGLGVKVDCNVRVGSGETMATCAGLWPPKIANPIKYPPANAPRTLPPMIAPRTQGRLPRPDLPLFVLI